MEPVQPDRQPAGGTIDYAFDENSDILPVVHQSGDRYKDFGNASSSRSYHDRIHKRYSEACTKLGIAVRGLYGENSEASGNMYQISNQVTLGLTEEEIISNINNIAKQIIDQERT